VTEEKKPENNPPRESEKPHQRSPKEDEQIDEALEETFPASDPPSYSRGLPKTE